MADLHVEVIDDLPDREGGLVQIPRAIAALDPSVRALLVLDLVHAAMSQLAALRAWDQSMLDAARRHAIDNGLVAREASRWRTAPDRHHRARSTREVGHDGRVVVRVEVRRASDRALVRRDHGWWSR